MNFLNFKNFVGEENKVQRTTENKAIEADFALDISQFTVG